MAKNKTTTIPNYSFEDTNNSNLKKFVDRNGDWTHYWLVKEKKFLPAVNRILGLGFAKGDRFYQYLLSVSKEEAQKKLSEKGEEGTRTHAAIRQLIDGLKVTMETKFFNELTGRQEVLTNDEWDNLMGFEAFCQRYQPQVVENDFSVYSVEHEYAGSPDALLVLTVPSGDKYFPKRVWGQKVLFLPDWKTSAAIYNEYKAQLAGYFKAVVELGGHVKFFEQYKGKIFTGIVRIGTNHKAKFELELWDEIETLKNFKLFKNAMGIYKDYEGEFAPVIEELPWQFYIKLPKAKITSTRSKKK